MQMSLFRLIIFFILLPTSITAQWQSIGDVQSFTRDGNRLTLNCGKAKVQITTLANDVVRVRMNPTGVFQEDFSWAVVKTDWSSISPEIRESATEIQLITAELKVAVQKSPCRISFYNAAGELINSDARKGMGWDGEQVRCWKAMPEDEFYYGFGEKAGRFQRKFLAMTMWNSDIPAYKADTDPLYETIPFFIGLQKGNSYGIFFDNTYWSSFDMGKESPDYYSFGANGGELNYYFFYGPEMKKVIQRYTDLIGRIPMPPRWALGYQQCRWSYYPEKRVRDLAENFRKRHIPCDAIYLDIDYMDGYRCFTWNYKNFPNPKKMLSNLAKDGFKFVVIIDPGIKADTSYWVYKSGAAGDHFVKYPDGKLFIGQVWPGDCAFPDFTKASTRAWWGNLYKDLLDVGIRGFWNDMNEPSVFNTPNKTFDLNVIHDDNGLKTDHQKNHNVYGMQMARGSYEGVKALRPNERPFVLTRASYAGGQRYAAAWTGDNISSWEHLYLGIPMCLNFGLSGQPFVGMDIGGFVDSPTGEMYARWLQYAALLPLCRTHTVINSKDQEPWSYGEKFEAINRKSIELRYRLLPYLYTLFYEATQNGLPIMRPLILEYPDDPEFLWQDDEFLVGRDMLVAPILQEGETKRGVYLPKGDWYDFWTGKKYEGKKWIDADAPMERIPIYVRAGAIIPMQQVMQYTDQAPIDPLTLDIYPAQNFVSSLYEDDGISFEYQNGKYRLTDFVYSEGTGEAVLKMKVVHNKFVPPKRSLVLKFNDMQSQPIQVVRAGKKIEMKAKMNQLEKEKEGWVFDVAAKVLWVKFADGMKDEMVVVKKK
jgi:alpha-glucosidase